MNATNATCSDDGHLSTAGDVCALVSLFIIMVAAATGNSVVLHVLLRRLRVRTVTNVFLSAMSVSDLLAATACMPVSVLTITWRPVVASDALCAVNETLNSTFGVMSTLMLTAVTVERYYWVVKLPPKHPLRLYTALVLVASAAAAASLVSMPWHLVTTHTNSTLLYKNGFHHCMYMFHGRGSHHGAVYSALYTAAAYVAPLVVMALSTGALWRLVHVYDSRIQPASSLPSQLRFRGEIRTAKTVIIMLLLFVVTRGPYIILAMAVAFGKCPFTPTMDTVAMWMFWTGCAVNPILYVLRNPNLTTILNIKKATYLAKQQQQPPTNIYAQNISSKDPSFCISKDCRTVSPAGVFINTFDAYNGSRSDSIPTVLNFFIDQRRKGSTQSAGTNCTTSTTTTV